MLHTCRTQSVESSVLTHDLSQALSQRCLDSGLASSLTSLAHPHAHLHQQTLAQLWQHCGHETQQQFLTIPTEHCGVGRNFVWNTFDNSHHTTGARTASTLPTLIFLSTPQVHAQHLHFRLLPLKLRGSSRKCRCCRAPVWWCMLHIWADLISHDHIMVAMRTHSAISVSVSHPRSRL